MERAYISENRGRGFLKGPVISLLCMAAFGLLSLALSAFLLLKTADPTAWVGIVGAFLPALTALLGGFASARINGTLGALSGLASGALFVALLFILRAFFGSGEASLGKVLVLYTLILLLSVLGGALGTAKRQKKRRYKRH